ncbi:hypothetical protein EYF80_030596 [Liparis tanakae]|uniref:Uncharacterized protein n=1 Tax=Liparis tanakae TaxID=230148 RepID=A0A4Z2H2B3_9TELE|nr:hypothetical protein EYF80_030596 [Liparis tanakae]
MNTQLRMRTLNKDVPVSSTISCRNDVVQDDDDATLPKEQKNPCFIRRTYAIVASCDIKSEPLLLIGQHELIFSDVLFFPLQPLLLLHVLLRLLLHRFLLILLFLLLLPLRPFAPVSLPALAVHLLLLLFGPPLPVVELSPEARDLHLELAQQSIFGILVHSGLVLDVLGPVGVAEGGEGLVVVLLGRA